MTALIDNTRRTKNLIRNAVRVQPSFREILEGELIKRGFTSKKFSHAKEPANRQADFLHLTFSSSTTTANNASTVLRGNGREVGFGADYMEVKVEFYASETIIYISHQARSKGACIASKTGSVKFSQPDNHPNPTVVFNYVDTILNRENIYLF